MALVVPDWDTMAPVWEHLKIMNRIANSVDPDETAHYEPSHPDLHCLQKYPSWSIQG